MSTYEPHNPGVLLACHIGINAVPDGHEEPTGLVGGNRNEPDAIGDVVGRVARVGGYANIHHMRQCELREFAFGFKVR